MADKRTCLVCGSKYSYCPHCSSDADKPKWYFLFCSENCNELDGILSKYTHKDITIAEAKEQILRKGLDKMNLLNEINKDAVADILSYGVKKEEPKQDRNNVKIDYKKKYKK